MDIKELSQEMNQFVMEKRWYDDGSIHPQTPRNLAISLSIEASEILEHFQWKDAPTNREAYEGELADVTLYLLQLANVTGVDLEKAVLKKLKQNYGRTWEAH